MVKEKKHRNLVFLGVLFLIIALIVLLSKGFFSAIFSFSSAGSWLLFLWFIFSILFLLIFLADIVRISFLKGFLGLIQTWLLTIYLVFSIFVVIDVWWQIIPFESVLESNAPSILGTWEVSANVSDRTDSECAWSGILTLTITDQTKNTFGGTVSYNQNPDPSIDCTIGNDVFAFKNVKVSGSEIKNIKIGSFGDFSGSFTENSITLDQSSSDQGANVVYVVRNNQLNLIRQ